MDRFIYIVLLDPIDWLSTVIAKWLVKQNWLEWESLDQDEQEGAKYIAKLMVVMASVLYFSITKL